jgi:hypothetical protein
VALQAEGALGGFKAGVDFAVFMARLKSRALSKQNQTQSFSEACGSRALSNRLLDRLTMALDQSLDGIEHD